MILRNRDKQIIITLSRKVRLLTHAQIAYGWWSLSLSGLKNSRRRLGQLVKAGWLVSSNVIADSIAISSAVATWSPGQLSLNFGTIAWQLQSRWTQNVRNEKVYVAAKFAANQFGGSSNGRVKKPKQATHDLGVSAVYLAMIKERPQDAEAWLGEDIYAGSRRGQVLPDAMLFDPDSTDPYLAIEFGGAYTKERLEEFHHDCQSRKLAYEIW